MGPTPTPSPPQGSDLINQLLKQYGLADGGIPSSVAGLLPGAGGGGQTSNYDIVTGYTLPTSVPQPGGYWFQPVTTPLKDLMDKFYSMSPKDMNNLSQKLVSAGLLTPQQAGDPTATAQAYQGVLEMVGKMNLAGNKITPDDYLSKYVSAFQQARPQNYSTTSRDVNLTDPTAAKQMLIQTLQSSLGRNPSASEYQAFLSSIHAAERANPTITTRSFKLNAGTNSYDLSGSTTQGGLDPSAYTMDYGSSHNQAEHGAYQAATTYFDALRGAVGAVV